ncbi:hypothetical protein RHGRI_000333 [Rhododendron griersonianum]|uniref:Uncharacterized protein n=1 Tax=Rhododendron griersonianum TaxID=479676 RepID=A0AAV6LG76_9ERIC|nr:hypothetical protein RHGRI_000333 [Rhododendron griersonianum]
MNSSALSYSQQFLLPFGNTTKSVCGNSSNNPTKSYFPQQTQLLENIAKEPTNQTEQNPKEK